MQILKKTLLFFLSFAFQFFFIYKINCIQNLFFFSPDIFLAILISFLILRKYFSLLLFIVLFGLTRDILSPINFGFYTILYSTAIILLSLYLNVFHKSKLFSKIFFCLLSTILIESSILILFAKKIITQNIASVILYIFFKIIENIISILIIYPLIKYICSKKQKKYTYYF